MFRALLPSLLIGLFATCLPADEPRRDDPDRPEQRLRVGDRPRPRDDDRDPVARPRLRRPPRAAERPRDPDRRPELDRALLGRHGLHPGHRPEHDHHPPQQHAAVLERIEHLRIAAEHLTHAGMHDMARRARDHAAQIERDFQGRPRPEHDLGSNRVVRQLHEQIEALRREVTALHEQVRRLTQDR